MSTRKFAIFCIQKPTALLVGGVLIAVLGCARSRAPRGETNQASTVPPVKSAPQPDVTSPPPVAPPSPHVHHGQAARPPATTEAEPPPPPPPPPEAVPLDRSVPVSEAPAPPKPDSNIVQVLYATDRQASGTPQSPTYGPNEDPGAHMSYGTAVVSIPPDHRMGRLEEPILDIKILYDPKKYVTIVGIKSADEASFFNQLRTDVANSPRKDALIFIHGFNVSFPEAIRRTAQLSYDLQFHGATVCYSWPSRGSVFAYTADEDSVQWTAMHLMNFLQAVYTESGATSIDIIAHSMGNRALLSALQLLGSSSTPQFDEVVLAAPDVAESLFTQLVPTVQKHAQRITLYASSKDQALVASARVNHYRRAGDSRGSLTIAPPVETIDASTVDTGLLGHSYFGDSNSVVSDLYYLVKDDFPASKRSRLEQKTIQAGIYWAFRP